jgi:type II secretory ATPase GspE/PulE/Tfp pilus assembly ATPase PilB-like protein
LAQEAEESQLGAPRRNQAGASGAGAAGQVILRVAVRARECSMSAIRLQIRAGQKVRELTFHRAQITIGRSPDCSVVLAVPWLEERHLILRKTGPAVAVRAASATARATLMGRPVAQEWMAVPPLGRLQIHGPQQQVISIDITTLTASAPEAAAGRAEAPGSAVGVAPRAPQGAEGGAAGGAGNYLEVVDRTGTRRVALDGGALTIGRHAGNRLVVIEPLASRFHCVIERTADGFVIRDLESRNGTKINGQPIHEAVMGHGDVVTIGQTEIKAVLAAPAGEGEESAAGTLVAAEPESEPGAAADAEVGGEVPSGAEIERLLRARAEALADGSFGEDDIVLLNARGQVVHQAGQTKKYRADAILTLRLILLVCFRSRATDIHVEPREGDVQVRVRVDGGMAEVARVHKDVGTRLLSAVKVLADIDIGQRNIIQEGHFAARVPAGPGARAAGLRRVDYRVSYAPAIHGQKLVVRILDAANAPLHVEDLLLPGKALELIRRASQQEVGMILVCGPTGSGKTTTLYAILRGIDVSQRNVVTIEDPVEIELAGVTQIPVNEGQGNTFSALLRSVLRQDPDAILIGEMRDAETARVGVQAGMTGHLVFSTVHARDAVGGIFRLLDLGVEPYLVSSGLQLVLAQRLVRLLCPHCKIPVAPTDAQAARMAELGITGVAAVYTPGGCARCLHTGYRGRRGIYEILNTTDPLREVILKSPSLVEIQKTLGPDNYLGLADNAYRLVAEGSVSFDEADRAV